MNTQKKLTQAILFSLIALFACQSPAKKSENRAEEQVSENLILLGNNLDSLKVDDFAFSEKLIAWLDQFEDSLNAINDRLRIKNEKSDAIMNSQLDSIRKKGYELQNKIHEWADTTNKNVGELRKDVIVTFDELKQAVKKSENYKRSQ